MEGTFTKAQSDFSRHAPYEAHKGQTPLARHNSAPEADMSGDILAAIEKADHDKIRDLLSTIPFDLVDAVLMPSKLERHLLRTPLMAAAASKNFATFGTVLHAVNRCIGVQVEHDRNALRRQQLVEIDQSGMTLTMIAARSGNVAILGATLGIIDHVQDPLRLLDQDYVGLTVLMHAASARVAASFTETFKAIQLHFRADEVENQLFKTTGGDLTILMLVARCENQMSLYAVASACRKALAPSKVRALLTETDGEGKTFLMHAASGSNDGSVSATAVTSTVLDTASSLSPNQQHKQQEHQKQPQRPAPSPRSSDAEGFSPSAHRQLTPVRRRTGSGYISDPAKATAAAAAVAAVAATGASERLKVGDTKKVASTMSFLLDKKEMRDPALLVFKAAWAWVRAALWKEQRREQLKAHDSFGRNILIHAVLSGRVGLFDTAFQAVQEAILDYEIDRILGIDKEDGLETIMEATLANASRDMVRLVGRRDAELKKSVTLRENASTIQAKITQFVPGKLIVIFQLILQEVTDDTGSLILLLVMSAIAPLLSLGSNYVERETPSSRDTPRRAVRSALLSAPAMFFWGLGTSTAGHGAMGLRPSNAAVALAVATIVIPALDAFFGSHRVENWADRLSCQERRFFDREDRNWAQARNRRVSIGPLQGRVEEKTRTSVLPTWRSPIMPGSVQAKAEPAQRQQEPRRPMGAIGEAREAESETKEHASQSPDEEKTTEV